MQGAPRGGELAIHPVSILRLLLNTDINGRRSKKNSYIFFVASFQHHLSQVFWRINLNVVLEDKLG